VNVTGVFMTCQAVARGMVKYGIRGSVVVIASMSGSIANRVRMGKGISFLVIAVINPPSLLFPYGSCLTICFLLPRMGYWY
jgi:NAD(P)-dependent dehydrogenase (short-subunit alcohol dehydrogenase family)